MSSIWEKENSLAKSFWETGTACPVYDMHGHMGPHPAIYFPCCEPEEMANYLRRCRVSKLVFSHHHVLFSAMRNAADVEICKAYPDVFLMYAGINPNYPEQIREDLAQFDSWAPYAVGLKCLADYHHVPMDDERYRYALEFADERSLPVLCHTWGGNGSCDGWAVMARVAEKYPHLKVLLGHCFYGDFDAAIRLANTYPNVYLELTAIPGDCGVIEKLVAGSGSEKIFFGTDLPWFDEYQAIGGVLSAKISDEDVRSILYRNAEKLLGIPPTQE